MKLKLKITFAFFILYNAAIFSQVYQAGNGGINFFRFSSNYRPAKIELNDGTIKNGFIAGFIENENIEIGSFSQFSNFEHQLNLDDNKFKFKINKESDDEKLSQENIKSISLINEASTKTYYLVDVFAIDKKTKKLQSLKRKAWLPLLHQGKKTNIYGFNLFINNRYVYTYYYLSIDDKTGVRFFDDSMGLCGKKCAIEYFGHFLNEVFVKNCEAMKPFVANTISESNMEKVKELNSKNNDEIKKIKKNKNLSKEEKEQMTTKLHQDFALNPIIELINEQEKNCK